MSKTFTFTQTINTSPSQVYNAFINQTMLNQWFCNGSYVRAQVGGTLALDWNVGFHAASEFKTLEPDKKIVLDWQGRYEPEPTLVEIDIEGDEKQSTVTVMHSGVKDTNDAWIQMIDEIERGWPEGLENLKSVLETGIDLRVQRRPIMGITPGAFNPQRAKELDVPVTSGLLIANVMEGFSAAEAGLQIDDVIITMDGNELGTFQQYLDATAGFKIEQTVEVVYYRGSEKLTTEMLLKERPLPQYPTTLPELINTIEELHTTVIAELRDLVSGIDAETLNTTPEEGAWSAAQVLAHLIWIERFTQMMIWATEGGNANVPYVGNNDIQLAGILHAHKANELVDVLETELAVTCGIVKALPPSFETRKADYLSVATKITTGPFLGPVHIRRHFPQIKAAIESVTTTV